MSKCIELLPCGWLDICVNEQLNNDIIHSQISQPVLSVQTFTRVQTVFGFGSIPWVLVFIFWFLFTLLFYWTYFSINACFFISHSISGVLLLASLVHIIDDNSSSSFTFLNLFLKLCCFVTLTSVLHIWMNGAVKMTMQFPTISKHTSREKQSSWK